MANSKISALTSASTPLAGTETLPVVQSGATKQVSVANLTAGRSVSTGNLSVETTTPFTFGTTSTAGARVGTQGTSGGSFMVQTPSLNASYGSGFAIDGTYNSGTSKSTINIKAFGVYSGGPYTSDLALYTSTGTTLTQQALLSNTGDLTLNTGNLVQGTAAKGFNFTANTPAAGMTSQLLNWYEAGTWTPTLGGTATYTRQQGYYTRIGRQVTVNCDFIVNVIGTGSTTTISGLPFSSLAPSPGSMGYFSNLNGTYVFIAPLSSGATVIFETMASAASDATDTTAIFKSGTRVIFTLSYFV